jgi:SpoVK/Ycf46/Vps4 family AAA+-type ATPase
MLELLDGSRKSDGVIVVGATNRPDDIDPAILRSGRLEQHVIIPAPDTDSLVGILALHLGIDLERVLASAPAQDVLTNDAVLTRKADQHSRDRLSAKAETSPENQGSIPGGSTNA